MRSNEIRKRFLQYFEGHGHTVVASSSLIPAEDPTLLFVNAGMNQFKDVFLGIDKRDYSRASTSQKCVRAGGKHNDLDNVGHTRRHHTFFEMLGNFSFGDYFKKDAIRFAWELLTREYGLPPGSLWVSVFREDDEAEALWQSEAGVGKDRIVRLDEKDNFWQMGDTGPCGPCSEIHYDFGPGASEEGHADCTFPCECGRYVEIWNLVFMQFDRDHGGSLTPLPKPSIDTGMGLERLATILQGKLSNYETDLLASLIDRAADLFGIRYGDSPKGDVSLRIVADHVRAATFLIGDGIIPSNEGRGYVLRKIMRRGIRQGTLVGRREPFLYLMSGQVVELMKDAYPGLVSTAEYVARVIENEESRFRTTVSIAVAKLDEITDEAVAGGSPTVRGKDIFKLYDTYGLPMDFTREIAREKNLELDIAGFDRELEKQRERARESWKGRQPAPEMYAPFIANGRTAFLGYDTTSADGWIVGLVVGEASVDTIGKPGARAELILDRTPFYAESGGQVGDTGYIVTEWGRARVLDTRSPVEGLVVHHVELVFGALGVNEPARAEVDGERRNRIRANHTGTHLLHAALRRTLGIHVKQAGSLVAPDRLRFDYTHYAALTDAQVDEIEGVVNRVILGNQAVETREMGLDEAVEAGAVAFFGEKYHQRVRVVNVPEFSMELCGGTHTGATGEIGLFKILTESSVAAGVRRIEAITGLACSERLDDDERLIDELASRMGSSRRALPRTIDRILEKQKQLENELGTLQRRSANSQLDDLVGQRTDAGGIPLVVRRIEGVEGALMRELAENTRNRLGSGVVVLGAVSGGKATLVAAVSGDLQQRVHAGRLIKQVALLVGGSGGGRPDFAQAGGKEPEHLDFALEQVRKIVSGSAA
jgi:alanyl-tRNA synthetase